jgi:glycosyltransferase involved in cell wall biosynthesis
MTFSPSSTDEPALAHQAMQGHPRANGQENGRPVLVSFVVPALNEELYIGRCLRSIQRLTRPAEVRAIEIIVVDNHSSDGTVRVSKEFGAEVVVVSPGRPSRARNAGARAARGDWFAFVDADCELDQNWLATCGLHLQSDSQVVAVAGAMGAPRQDASWVERTWYELAYATPDLAARKVRWLPTFNLLIRRDAFRRAGEFDESLATCEDSDLGYKVGDFGKLVLDPSTQAAHLGESQTLAELFRREAWRTRGNLQLALARPWDWSNWFSLLVPPGLLGGLLLSVFGAMIARVAGRPVWPWLAILALVLGVASVAVIKKARSKNLLAFGKQMIVLITYLAGRATGLIWTFGRLER